MLLCAFACCFLFCFCHVADDCTWAQKRSNKEEKSTLNDWVSQQFFSNIQKKRLASSRRKNNRQKIQTIFNEKKTNQEGKYNNNKTKKEKLEITW